MKNFQEFMAAKLRAHPLSNQFKGDVGKFITTMLPAMGFDPWLESNRDAIFTTQDTEHLVNVYLTYGQREPEDIPSLLGLIARQYGITADVPSEWRKKEHWV
jgi:hypothetical protein